MLVKENYAVGRLEPGKDGFALEGFLLLQGKRLGVLEFGDDLRCKCAEMADALYVVVNQLGKGREGCLADK